MRCFCVRIILFVIAFLLFLSCVFSVVDKLFDTDMIFKSRKNTIYLYVISSMFSVIFAIGYDYLVYGILK